MVMNKNVYNDKLARMNEMRAQMEKRRADMEEKRARVMETSARLEVCYNQASNAFQNNGVFTAHGPLSINIAKDTTDEELLRSLRPVDFSLTLDERRIKFTKNTCDWILQREEFQSWAEDDSESVLWTFGKPGSGKSFLADKVCEHFRNEDAILTYFFFEEKNAVEDRNSIKLFYQTMLHQLLSYSFKAGDDMKESCFRIAREPLSSEDLKEASRRVVQAMDKPVYLIIDALDECTGTGPSVLNDWLEDIRDFINLHIAITSIGSNEFESMVRIPGEYVLQLSSVDENTKQDIRLFLRGRLENKRSALNTLPVQTRERIAEKLAEKADGMFLYARSLLDVLEVIAGGEQDIIEEIDRLPREIRELYAYRLNKISDSGATTKFVIRIFQWLAACKYPPTIHELNYADAINLTSDRAKTYELSSGESPYAILREEGRFKRFLSQLLTHCVPMIEVLENGIVQFVHHTVPQFLMAKHPENEPQNSRCPDRFRIQIESSHEYITTTCVTYLHWHFRCSSDLPGAETEVLGEKDLQKYAVLGWDYHAKKSNEQMMEEEGVGSRRKEGELLVAFCKGEAFKGWLSCRANSDPTAGDLVTLSTKPADVAKRLLLSRLEFALREMEEQSLIHLPTQIAKVPEQSIAHMLNEVAKVPEQSLTYVPTEITRVPEKSLTHVPSEITNVPEQSLTLIPTESVKSTEQNLILMSSQTGQGMMIPVHAPVQEKQGEELAELGECIVDHAIDYANERTKAYLGKNPELVKSKELVALLYLGYMLEGLWVFSLMALFTIVFLVCFACFTFMLGYCVYYFLYGVCVLLICSLGLFSVAVLAFWCYGGVMTIIFWIYALCATASLPRRFLLYVSSRLPLRLLIEDYKKEMKKKALDNGSDSISKMEPLALPEGAVI